MSLSRCPNLHFRRPFERVAELVKEASVDVVGLVAEEDPCGGEFLRAAARFFDRVLRGLERRGVG